MMRSCTCVVGAARPRPLAQLQRPPRVRHALGVRVVGEPGLLVHAPHRVAEVVAVAADQLGRAGCPRAGTRGAGRRGATRSAAPASRAQERRALAGDVAERADEVAPDHHADRPSRSAMRRRIGRRPPRAPRRVTLARRDPRRLGRAVGAARGGARDDRAAALAGGAGRRAPSRARAWRPCCCPTAASRCGCRSSRWPRRSPARCWCRRCCCGWPRRCAGGWCASRCARVNQAGGLLVGAAIGLALAWLAGAVALYQPGDRATGDPRGGPALQHPLRRPARRPARRAARRPGAHRPVPAHPAARRPPCRRRTSRCCATPSPCGPGFGGAGARPRLRAGEAGVRVGGRRRPGGHQRPRHRGPGRHPPDPARRALARRRAGLRRRRQRRRRCCARPTSACAPLPLGDAPGAAESVVLLGYPNGGALVAEAATAAAPRTVFAPDAYGEGTGGAQRGGHPRHPRARARSGGPGRGPRRRGGGDDLRRLARRRLRRRRPAGPDPPRPGRRRSARSTRGRARRRVRFRR